MVTAGLGSYCVGGENGSSILVYIRGGGELNCRGNANGRSFASSVY